MKEKRALHKEKISEHHQQIQKRKLENEVIENRSETKLTNCNSDDIKTAFNEVVAPKKVNIDNLYKSKKRLKRDENYIPYAPVDKHTEEG